MMSLQISLFFISEKLHEEDLKLCCFQIWLHGCIFYIFPEWNEKNDNVEAIMVYLVSIMCYLNKCVYCFTFYSL